MIIFASILVISACSGSSSDDKDASNTGSNEDKSNKELVYLATQDIATIDPAKHTDETSMHMVLNIYDPFIRPNVEEGTMEPSPHIAESWNIDESGKVYEFKIREDVTFHSGNQLTADDVLYSIERMLAIGQGYSWLWDNVLMMDNIEKVDDYNIKITLDEPYAPLLSTFTQLLIVDSKLVKENQKDGEFGENGDYGQEFLTENTAGSGPYMIKDWQRGSDIKLTAFEDYWRGWEDNQIKDIKYMVGVNEEATHKTMLQSGEADFVDQWMSVESQLELGKQDGIKLEEDPSSQLYHIIMNTQKPPLDDKNFRKAISYAFNYELHNNEILGGADQAQGPVPLLVPGHSEEAIVYNYDLEKAKQYLDQSKYSPDEYKIEYYYVADIEEERKTGLLLQSNLKELGIQLELVGVPWTQITEITADVSTTPHMIATYDTLKYPHVDSHTYGLYHPSSHGSYRSASWYDNDEVTELLEKARAATDEEEQMNYYKEVQNIVTDDAVSLFIANPTHRIVYNEDIDGYTYVGLLGYDTVFYDFKWK